MVKLLLRAALVSIALIHQTRRTINHLDLILFNVVEDALALQILESQKCSVEWDTGLVEDCRLRQQLHSMKRRSLLYDTKRFFESAALRSATWADCVALQRVSVYFETTKIKHTGTGSSAAGAS
jgi:hypothetical protein